MSAWEISRTGATVQVAVGPDDLGREDEIADALERVTDETVEVVRVTGSALEQPRRGLSALLRRISDVAVAHGKRFHVGPI
jgi:hypothetical protein